MAKKIFVVEDDRGLASALEDKLKKSGFGVELAYDGAEALAKVEEAKPDLIILDIILPKIDGIQVLKGIKEKPATKDVPVVVLTQLSDDETISKIIEGGAKDYLVKGDVTLDDVIARINERLTS